MGHADIAAGRGVLWLCSLIYRSGKEGLNCIPPKLRHDVANLDRLPFTCLISVAGQQDVGYAIVATGSGVLRLHSSVTGAFVLDNRKEWGIELDPSELLVLAIF